MKFDPFKLYKAIISISPNAQYSCEGDCYEGLTWHKEQRAAEYPSYAEQFDKIFREGVDAWKADIQAIKDKYPKQTMDSDELERRKQQALTELETES